MLVNGELIDNPHAEFKQVVEYKLENSMTESYQQSRKSAYSQALGTSLESFRNNYHNYASATNMPVDLVRESVGTNSVQVVPINEVVASLTSTPIGMRKQPYARDHTSHSPTFNGESDDNHKEDGESFNGESDDNHKEEGGSFNGESDDNHKEEGESQGVTQENLKSQGSDKESQSQRSDADSKSKGSDADSKSECSDEDSKSQGSDEKSQSEGSEADANSQAQSQASDEKSESQTSDEPSDGNATKEDETSLDNTDNICCCGCGAVAASTHCCSNTGKKVTHGCYDPRQDRDEEVGDKGVCKGCYPEMEASYCCCGCRYIASNSKHKCLHTGKHVRPY